jgi:hypothetical protein
MKDPYRAIVWHVLLLPITILIADIIIQFGADPNALGVFILAIPFLYIGLCLPAAITGLAYWYTRMRKRMNRIKAFIIVGIVAEVSCVAWVLGFSNLGKEEIFDAVLAVGIAISILYWITAFTLHPNTDQGGRINSESLRSSA